MWDWVTIRYRHGIQSLIVPVGRQSPERFGTICKGEAHGLDEGRIIPICSIWLNSAFAAFSLSGEGVRTPEHLWSQCGVLLSELICSQQNSSLLTPDKSVIRFGIGRRWRQ